MKIVGAHITLKGNQLDKQIQLGSISLSNYERQAKFGIVSFTRYHDENSDETGIDLTLASGMDLFPECKYDLLPMDYLNGNLNASVEFECEDCMDKFISASLTVKANQQKFDILLKLQN